LRWGIAEAIAIGCTRRTTACLFTLIALRVVSRFQLAHRSATDFSSFLVIHEYYAASCDWDSFSDGELQGRARTEFYNGEHLLTRDQNGG